MVTAAIPTCLCFVFRIAGGNSQILAEYLENVYTERIYKEVL